MAARDEKTEWLRVQVYRQMSPAERVQMAVEMSEESLDIVRSAILDERPDITPAELKRELRRRVLPRHLFEAVERATGQTRRSRDGTARRFSSST